MTHRRRGSSPAAPPHALEDDDLLQEIFLRLPPQPLIGVFHRSSEGIVFVPVLVPPDRIPTQRFDLRLNSDYTVLGCRDGLVLAMHWWQGELRVCDPITDEYCRLAIPPEFRRGLVNGAILCPAADDQGHVHGAGCDFKVVLMTMYGDDYRRKLAHGAISSKQPLHVSLRMVVFLGHLLRDVNSHDVATWVLWKTVEMHNILGLPRNVTKSTMLGYFVDDDAYFIFLEGTVYMVHLKTRCNPRNFMKQSISIITILSQVSTHQA
ncbi:unnamed protein product [Alopecurus aequalis]